MPTREWCEFLLNLNPIIWKKKRGSCGKSVLILWMIMRFIWNYDISLEDDGTYNQLYSGWVCLNNGSSWGIPSNLCHFDGAARNLCAMSILLVRYSHSASIERICGFIWATISPVADQFLTPLPSEVDGYSMIRHDNHDIAQSEMGWPRLVHSFTRLWSNCTVAD